jgi:hypothetical protein
MENNLLKKKKKIMRNLVKANLKRKLIIQITSFVIVSYW